MSKRVHSRMMTESSKPKQPKHWSLGLLNSMNDPTCVLRETENIVVISDKYPKARIHYLILPRDDITSIYKLTEDHLGLLEEFNMIYEELQEKHKDTILRGGFHAVPSMQRMHMHVISIDMISPCLKSKIHWNSFTTEFFKPYQDVVKEIKETGSIKKISPDTHKSLLASTLKCNQCSYQPKNIPQLKQHLLTHVENS